MCIFEGLFWGLKETRKVTHEAVFFKPKSESWVADLGVVTERWKEKMWASLGKYASPVEANGPAP